MQPNAPGNQKASLQVVRKFLVKLIVEKLEERIRNQSISVVLEGTVNEAIESVIHMDSLAEGFEYCIPDMYDEVLAECFTKIEGFTKDSELAHLLASKRFSEGVTGAEVLDTLKV
jgi:hypothetical protein